MLKAVGSHAFTKGGARGASDDYDNPVGHGLHSVVLVSLPLKGGGCCGWTISKVATRATP